MPILTLIFLVIQFMNFHSTSESKRTSAGVGVSNKRIEVPGISQVWRPHWVLFVIITGSVTFG